MTDEELISEIADMILMQGDGRIEIIAHGKIPNSYKEPIEVATEILALIKQAGYVQVRKGDLYISMEEAARPDPAKGLYED